MKSSTKEPTDHFSTRYQKYSFIAFQEGFRQAGAREKAIEMPVHLISSRFLS